LKYPKIIKQQTQTRHQTGTIEANDNFQNYNWTMADDQKVTKTKSCKTEICKQLGEKSTNN